MANKLVILFSVILAVSWLSTSKGETGTGSTIHYWIRPDSHNVTKSNTEIITATSDCELPKDSGTCLRKIYSYYFDMRTRRCRPFTWTGCGGNGNKFFSRQECRFACHYFMKIRPPAKVRPLRILNPVLNDKPTMN